MNVGYKTKRGDAHAIIIIVLVVVIIGLLGFVIWQNYLAPKDDEGKKDAAASKTDSASKSDPVEKKETKTYDGLVVSFEYPVSGWRVDEVSYGEDTQRTPELKTEDYVQFGMGIKSGAIITVHVENRKTTTDDEYRKVYAEVYNQNADEPKVAKVNGTPVITYNSGYEGMRYHSIFVQNGKVVDVVYRYHDDGQASEYMNVYDAVVSSLVIK